MTTSRSDLLRKRFGNHRPGLQLVGIVDAALPVTILKVDVLAQERKELPLLEEFILRFVHAGVVELDELAGLMGLDRDQVLTSSAVQITENHLRRSPSAQLSLTAEGLEVTRTLSAIQPVIKPISITFDRLLWGLQDYVQSSLIKKQDAKDRGLLLLPAERSARITTSDVTVEEFNALLLARPSRIREIEILRVRKIASQNQHRYIPADLLVYGDTSTGEIELGLCIEGELRPTHGLQLAAIDAVSRLELAVGKPEPRPTLDPDLERIRVSQAELDSKVDDVETPTSTKASLVPEPAVPEVRSVSVFEHPDLLSQALGSARKRLLIMSPWIKGTVVTTEFLEKLDRRLRAGVVVHIAHGMGHDDSGSHEWALRRLRNLHDRYPEKFTFARMKNTHAKILIFDGTWINTSFNWLSFKGDPNRTFRMEEGTLVTIPDHVDNAYDQYVQAISDEQVDLGH